jgi:hypothetical protein
MNHISRRLAVLVISATLALPTSGAFAAEPDQEKRSTLSDQRAIAVTIYNDNLALVKEVRGVVLDAGMNRLTVRDVSARMQPETALLRGMTHPDGLRPVEQNFDFDLLTPEKLLEKNVGRTVGIVKTHPTTGQETVVRAEVLSAQDGVVLRIGDRVETGVPGRLVFDGVPSDLRDRPTLSVLLSSRTGGPQDIELSYLTGGLSWRADYVVELSASDDKVDLAGWVTLTNASGTAYRNARLQLVAGNVNRVEENLAKRKPESRGLLKVKESFADLVEESLFEYHLYTLERATTLADNQTKQVALLNASGVTARKELVLQGHRHYYGGSYGEIGEKLKLDVMLEFDNSEQSRLGMPLPKGVVRVYKRDSKGDAQFVGEDRIDHTPKNEAVRLKLGQAFDVTADRKQTDFSRKRSLGSDYVTESGYEIVLKNAKTEPVTVVVREPLGGDWKMLEESHPHEKLAAGTAQWRLTIPPASQVPLRYRVRVRY